MTFYETNSFADGSVSHHVMSSIGKSCKISRKELRDRNSARYTTTVSHRSFTWVLFLLRQRSQRSRVWDQLRGEPTRSNPVRDNNDQAQGSCIDLRVQGETDHSAVEEESKRSLIKSLMKQILDSPWTYWWPDYKQKTTTRSTKRSSGCHGHRSRTRQS